MLANAFSCSGTFNGRCNLETFSYAMMNRSHGPEWPPSHAKKAIRKLNQGIKD